nr:MAG TPA: hypothetical protein [Bacteriophage sp.]
MDVSITICKAHNMTPFQLFRERTDEVIMLINYYIEKGDSAEYTAPKVGKPKGEQRIRVNDRTASGGWF